MTPDRKPRLVCFTPCASIDELLRNDGTLGIIASEQFLILRQEISDYIVEVYSPDAAYDRRQDVLLLLTVLPHVPDEVMLRFDRVVHFFDDLDAWKLQGDPVYAAKASLVSAVLHPLESVARQLEAMLRKPCVGVPWSLARVPANPSPRTAAPSLFVDMDPRPGVARSVEHAAIFIQAVATIAGAITVPESCHQLLPEAIQRRVTPIPHLPHDDFLRLIGSAWFYASGIGGSYEFVVLESAFLGCGLISLHGALRTEHLGRTGVLHFDGQADFANAFQDAIQRFDPAAIAQDARRLYSREGLRNIPRTLHSLFGPASDGGRP